MIWLAESVWQHPAVIGLLIGLPSSALGYMVYRRSRDVDAVAEQAGIATGQRESIGQVVDGLNKIITALQQDNAFLREEVVAGRKDIAACLQNVTELRDQVNDLAAELRLSRTQQGGGTSISDPAGA